MGRREMREHIFKLLFLREFNEAEEMPEQIKLYFDEISRYGTARRPARQETLSALQSDRVGMKGVKP